MADVVVVGGGIGGLGTALALSRAGDHRVTVVERDAAPLPPTPDEAFDLWPRRGAPQVRQSHAFLARLRLLLRDRAPDVLERLAAAGVSDLSFTDPLPPTLDDLSAWPGDDDLVALACRRTTFEWVLRSAVLDQPGVSFDDGAAVRGLVAAGGRVAGIELDGGRHIPADLVVDASGRRSALPRWLEAIGAPPVEETTEDCGLVYCTRFYRLRPGADRPRQAGVTFGDVGYVKFAVFPADNGAFSVTFGVAADDTDLRGLADRRSFELAVAAFPGLQAWVERAEPISDVELMAGMVNRRRRLVIGGEPVVTGLVALGDAAICTNPLYGRGCTLAFLHAFALADLLATGADPVSVSGPFDGVTRAEIEPWYDAAVAQDRGTRRRQEPVSVEAAPPPEPGTPNLGSLLRDGLMAATRSDAKVYRAFVRTLNLLDPPTAMLNDPDIVARVLAVWNDRDNRPKPIRPGPRRTELLAALAAA